MKKSELYKIVKEALNEVLQEQRAQRPLKLDPDRKQRDRRDPRDPKDPIRPIMMDGTTFFSAYTTDCKEVQIDDAWVCGGANNTSLQPNEETGIIVLTNYTNMPASEYTEDNIPSSGCANVSELTLEGFASWLSTTTVFDGMSTSAIINGLGIFPASDSNIIEGCIGCNVQYATDGLVGDQIEATNYSSNLLDSALADVSYCIYPGCTDSNAINFNSNANENDGSCYYDQGEEDPGCTQTWSSNYSQDAEVEDGTCASYIVGGCTDDDYVEGQSVTDETTGQVSYPNQSQDVQAAMAEAQTIVDAYNAQYGGSATVNIVAADVIDNTLDSDEYCYTEAIFGCMDSSFDNYNPLANVDNGSCANTAGETIYGCMDQDACNYSPLATVQAIGPNQPGDPCVIPTEPCDECETDENGVNTGNIINTDTDGDGICDAQEIPGCTNSTALNYNPDATDDDGSCEFEVKCKNIKAIVCNAPQVRGQKKVAYAPISLACVTIDGQTPNMELPATSQFKYPLPSNIVDPAGNTVSPLKRTTAIWRVTSITTATGYSADQVTDLPFGNCKGPVQVIGDRDPRPLDPSPKEPYFSDPTNPLGDPTSTGYDRVNDPDVEDSRKLREAFEFEFKLTEEQKLRKLIKDTLKQLKK
jgi:hypothetical protein